MKDHPDPDERDVKIVKCRNGRESGLKPGLPRESEQEEPIIQHHPGWKHAKSGHNQGCRRGQKLDEGGGVR